MHKIRELYGLAAKTGRLATKAAANDASRFQRQERLTGAAAADRLRQDATRMRRRMVQLLAYGAEVSPGSDVSDVSEDDGSDNEDFSKELENALLGSSAGGAGGGPGSRRGRAGADAEEDESEDLVVRTPPHHHATRYGLARSCA